MLSAWLVVGCQGAAPTAAKTAPAAQVPDKSGVITIPPDSPMLSQIRVAAVTEEELAVDEVVSPAKLEIDPSRLSHVLLPAPGRIVKVHVRLGDAVKAGDVLITLDSPDADAAIADFKQAEADVSAANAAMTKAKSDRERVKGLFEKDAVARKEVDNVEAAFAAARSEVVRAQAERQQAQRKLKLLGITGTSKTGSETIDVLASMSGKVMELRVASGEFHSDTSTPLMTVADLSSVMVSADVAENLIRFIELGEPVQIDLVAFPGETFDATVVRIADTVVLVAPPNLEGLRDTGRLLDYLSALRAGAPPIVVINGAGGGDGELSRAVIEDRIGQPVAAWIPALWRAAAAAAARGRPIAACTGGTSPFTQLAMQVTGHKPRRRRWWHR